MKLNLMTFAKYFTRILVIASLCSPMLCMMQGCGSGSNEAVAPEKFAPPPPSDTPAGVPKAQASESVQG